MKKRWKVALIAVALLIIAGCTDKSQASSKEKKEVKKITFVLDWTPNTNHTGLYVAQQKGYYEEEGFEVEIVQPSDGDASMIVGSGKADFGITAQDSMAPNFASEAPLPITAVATILQHNTSGIMSRKGEGLDRPKGLENKTYATWDSPVEQKMISDVMKKDGGGNFSKVNLIPNTIVDEPLALKEKQTDALWVFYGWGGITAEIENVPIDYFYFKDLNPVFDYYTPVIISNESFLEKNAEDAEKFLRATAKGYEFAAEQPKEAAEILTEQVPELNTELVKKSQEWLADQYLTEDKKWGYIEPDRWNNFYSWLGDNKLITEKIPENTGFTNQYLAE